VEYLPFGEVWIEETDPATGYIPFRFTSKELDEETGLYYHGARYYEPTISRWMSADPAGWVLINPMDEDGEPVPDGWPEGFGPGPSVGMKPDYSIIEAANWYAYVSNNPVKYVDPTGMEKEFFVGYVPVVPGLFHTFIFWEDDETGKDANIVEGFPENRVGTKDKSSFGWGNLEKDMATKPEEAKKRDILPIPDGMSPEEFEQELKDNLESYDDSVRYEALPEKNDDSGNSNSLVGSVLRESGSDYEPSRLAPGWDKDVLPPSSTEESIK